VAFLRYQVGPLSYPSKPLPTKMGLAGEQLGWLSPTKELIKFCGPSSTWHQPRFVFGIRFL